MTALVALSALGQTVPEGARTVRIANTTDAAGFDQMKSVVSYLAEIQQFSGDVAQSSVVVSGPEDRLALAEWLIHAMNKLAGWQPSDEESSDSSVREFLLPAGFDPVTRVYYVKHHGWIQDCHEMADILKSVAEVRAACRYGDPEMIAFRGSPERVGLAEWLLEATDKPSGWKPEPETIQSPASREYRLPGDSLPVVRIYYPANSGENVSIQNLIFLDTLWKVSGVKRVQTYNRPRMIAFRGTADEVEMGEWLLRETDVPEVQTSLLARDRTSIREYRTGQSVAVVCPLKNPAGGPRRTGNLVGAAHPCRTAEC